MKKEVFRSLTLISQLGVSVMVPMFMCLGIGLFIDKRFGTSTAVWLMFLGLAAGFRNAIILAKQVLKENSKTSSDRYQSYKGYDSYQSGYQADELLENHSRKELSQDEDKKG